MEEKGAKAYYIPDRSGSSTTFLEKDEKMATVMNYFDLRVSKKFQKLILPAAEMSNRSPSALVNFYRILDNCRKIRGTDPKSVERTLYTMFPFLPDTSIAQFGTIAVIHHLETLLKKKITRTYKNPSSTDLWTINGITPVEVYNKNFLVDEPTVIFAPQLGDKDTAAFYSLVTSLKSFKIVKMYLPRTMFSEFYAFIIANKFSAFIGEAPHNGLFYLYTDEKFKIENTILNINLIAYAGIEVNTARSFNFLKKTPLNEVYAAHEYLKAVKFFSPVIASLKSCQFKNIGEIEMMKFDELKKSIVIVNDMDISLGLKRYGGQEHVDAIFGGLNVNVISDMFEKPDEDTEIAFAMHLIRLFKERKHDEQEVKATMAVLFGKEFDGDTYDDFSFKGYKSMNPEMKNGDISENPVKKAKIEETD